MTSRTWLLSSFTVALILNVFAPPNAVAQIPPQLRPEISGSYVRIFGGMGYTFAIDIRAPVPVDFLNTDHSFGLQAWYGTTDVVTRGSVFTNGGTTLTSAGSDRAILGAGANWRTGFRFANNRIRPYVSLPVQYVRSSIETVRWMLAPPVQEQPPVIPPSYDRPGTETGFAYGIGTGIELWPHNAVGVGFSTTILRHNLYEDHGPPWLFFSFGLLYATDRL